MTGRDRVQFRDRKRTGQAVVALAADTIHAIYFDALSNPVETNPRNNVASLFFFFLFSPSSLHPSFSPPPTIFSVQSLFARKTIPPFFFPPLDGFSRAKKDSTAAEKGKAANRIVSFPRVQKYSAFIRWNSSSIRAGTKFTRCLNPMFAVVERV